jgi:glutamate-1-semialdehyde 2,1-aminomutase
MPNRYTESERLYHRAMQWTPGASQTGSKAPGKAGPLDKYPLYLSSGRGPHVMDVDGNQYLDFIASLAAVGLGHANARVFDAVNAELAGGALLSLPTELEANASEALCQATGWAEQARWVKTGSEATEAAVRIARCATGRDRIMTVRSGYHAWHTWFQAVKPDHPGVPDVMEKLITGITYGDKDDAMRYLCHSLFAAVILEPAPITGDGSRLWLEWLVETAHKYGTLVIFDEVVWGFRLAGAGGTEYFGVTPDLATYGKALGNGIPVGAVVGTRALMQFANVISGTFGGDGLGLAAALTVMDIYEQDGAVQAMWGLGRRFQKGINAPGKWIGSTGYPVHPILHIGIPDTSEAVAMSYFLQQLAERGVLWHPAGGNIMVAHTEATIDLAVSIFHEAACETARAATLRPLAELVTPYEVAFARRAS